MVIVYTQLHAVYCRHSRRLPRATGVWCDCVCAINAANAHGTKNTIRLEAGTYRESAKNRITIPIGLLTCEYNEAFRKRSPCAHELLLTNGFVTKGAKAIMAENDMAP
jgi:hypothetical protein